MSVLPSFEEIDSLFCFFQFIHTDVLQGYPLLGNHNIKNIGFSPSCCQPRCAFPSRGLAVGGHRGLRCTRRLVGGAKGHRAIPQLSSCSAGPSVWKTRPSLPTPSAHRQEPGGDHLQGPSSIGPTAAAPPCRARQPANLSSCRFPQRVPKVALLAEQSARHWPVPWSLRRWEERAGTRPRRCTTLLVTGDGQAHRWARWA